MDINLHIRGLGFIAILMSQNSKRNLLLPCILCDDEADDRRKLLWGNEIENNPPVVDYNEIMAPETSHIGVGKWTKNIVQNLAMQLIIRMIQDSHSSIMSHPLRKQQKPSSNNWPTLCLLTMEDSGISQAISNTLTRLIPPSPSQHIPTQPIMDKVQAYNSSYSQASKLSNFSTV
jgi:hypothetical protein